MKRLSRQEALRRLGLSDHTDDTSNRHSQNRFGGNVTGFTPPPCANLVRYLQQTEAAEPSTFGDAQFAFGQCLSGLSQVAQAGRYRLGGMYMATFIDLREAQGGQHQEGR